jgi:hypothetical protein
MTEAKLERLAREAVELILAREVTRGASLAHALRVAKIVASLLLDDDAKAAPIVERAAEAFADHSATDEVATKLPAQRDLGARRGS